MALRNVDVGKGAADRIAARASGVGTETDKTIVNRGLDALAKMTARKAGIWITGAVISAGSLGVATDMGNSTPHVINPPTSTTTTVTTIPPTTTTTTTTTTTVPPTTIPPAPTTTTTTAPSPTIGTLTNNETNDGKMDMGQTATLTIANITNASSVELQVLSNSTWTTVQTKLTNGSESATVVFDFTPSKSGRIALRAVAVGAGGEAISNSSELIVASGTTTSTTLPPPGIN